MSQHIFSISQNPREAGSDTREGVNLPGVGKEIKQSYTETTNLLQKTTLKFNFKGEKEKGSVEAESQPLAAHKVNVTRGYRLPGTQAPTSHRPSGEHHAQPSSLGF